MVGAGAGRARPVEEKKGADKGIDGRIYIHDEAADRGAGKQAITKLGFSLPEVDDHSCWSLEDSTPATYYASSCE